MARKLREFGGAEGYEVSFALHPIREGLALDFRLRGEIGALHAEPLEPLRLRAGRDLWKRTCLEAFFFEEESERYVELNWNVLGEHDLLAFASYRRRSDVAHGFEVLSIERRIAPGELDSRLRLALPARPYLLSPTVVLVPSAAAPLHYALAHGDRPDFHARSLVEALGVRIEDVGRP